MDPDIRVLEGKAMNWLEKFIRSVFAFGLLAMILLHLRDWDEEDETDADL